MRPLVDLVTLVGGPTVVIRRGTKDHREICRLYALYHRGERAGLLTVNAADELAVRLLGLHPAHVWGEVWWRAGNGLAAIGRSRVALASGPGASSGTHRVAPGAGLRGKWEDVER
jgi:hypothetical protein